MYYTSLRLDSKMSSLFTSITTSQQQSVTKIGEKTYIQFNNMYRKNVISIEIPHVKPEYLTLRTRKSSNNYFPTDSV